MEANEIRAAAGALFDQHRDRRDLTPIDPAVAPRTVDDAYRVQDALLGRWTQPPGHHVAGWKIALTTPVMQSFVGIDHPLAGAILSPRVHPSPARLAAEDYVNLGVESEIAVRIASDAGADGAPYDRERIAVHVAACMAATEVIDDRHCDYGHPDPPLLIADNAFNAGCVLGPERTDWRALDLTAARARMRIDGEIVGEGIGGDVLGHPFAALAWLANHLLGRGRRLQAGEIVLTGSIVTTHWLAPGQVMETGIDGLGAARLAVA